jgi:hypothetical protein
MNDPVISFRIIINDHIILFQIFIFPRYFTSYIVVIVSSILVRVIQFDLRLIKIRKIKYSTTNSRIPIVGCPYW